MQHKDQLTKQNNITPKEEQRTSLCCNKVVNRCSSLGFNNDNLSEDIALDYLASIVVGIYLNLEYEE